MSEKKSLFEVIKENLVNGELPDDFSLPREEAGEGELKWEDGAMDGVRGPDHDNRGREIPVACRKVQGVIAVKLFCEYTDCAREFKSPGRL